MSLPTQSEVNYPNQNPNLNQNPYPSMSSGGGYPEPPIGVKGGIYEKPNQNIPNNQTPPPQNYGAPTPGPMQPHGPMPPMQAHGPMPPMQAHGPMPPMPPHGPMPMATPVYVPPPVPGTVPVGAVPVYPRPYPVPYGVYPPYPCPYPYPYGVPHATVLVLPPGYQRDFSGGYSPWGNLAEDLDSLF